MSSKPPSQEQSSRTQDLEATGAFSVPPPDLAPTEQLSVGPADPGATLPTDSPGQTENLNVPGSTEFLLPDAAAPAPPLPATPQPSFPEGTGAYLAQEIHATGEYVPGSHENPVVVVPGGATGAYESSPGGVTGAYESSPGGPEDAPPEAGPAAPRCGRYTLKRFHAKGGMGEIWVAEDPEIGRSVALKRILRKRSGQLHRFLVEAQITGQLEHPGIVPVHELGVTAEGQPFYTMKFVRGRTLQKAIKEHHAAPPRSAGREVEQLRLLQIFLSLCQTVAYAHSRGVLHRDLKPENVMLGAYGETLLLDWGIAKVMDQPGAIAAPAGPPDAEREAAAVQLHEATKTTATQMGAIMGSPSYMSPEVASGLNNEVDQRSDVYLLGGTLYEILTGQLPREGTTAMDIIRKAQREPPLPPRKVNPEVSKPLNAICLKAMAQRKEDRYQTALDLAEDVQRYVAGEPVSAYPEDFVARAWRWAKRHRQALTRTAGAVLLLGLLLAGYGRLREAEQRRLDALREAAELREQEQARRDVKEFRHLADEASFYAATTDPVAEHAPFFDPREGEIKARAALALAAPWGETLEKLPLPDDRDAVKKERYEVVLLLAQTISQRGTGAAAGPAAQETLALLEDASRLSAPSRSYYRLRAQASRQLGDEKGAAQDQQLADDPHTPVTSLDHFFLGEQHRTASARQTRVERLWKAWQASPKHLEKTIEEYRLALAIDPDHYWSHFQLGRCYLNLGRFGEAVEALGACVALRPEAPWGYSIRGLGLAQQKRYREAERDLDRAVQLSPNSRAAQLTRGVIRWSQKKRKQALDDFDAVLQPPSEKQLLEAAYYRGQLYLQEGKIDLALKDFDRVVAEKPDFRPVYQYRALIHIAGGNNARGLEDLDRYLANRPSGNAAGWEAPAQRGRLLRLLYTEFPLAQRQQPAGQALAALAVAQLTRAVALGGQSADLFDDLGAVLEHTGRLEEAIAAYSKGLSLAPKDLRLLLKRGWAYEQLNDHVKAQADFAAAAGIDPDNAEAHTGLGYVRALGKLPAEAQREADLALLHGADDYMILHNVACIYAALSQADNRQAAAHQDAAMAVLRRAVKLWQRDGAGPNEIDLIKGDPALQILLPRDDCKKLLRGNEI